MNTFRKILNVCRKDCIGTILEGDVVEADLEWYFGVDSEIKLEILLIFCDLNEGV